MTLEACYAAMGGDYEGAMSRLRSEKLLQKFVLKFPEDTNMAAIRAGLSAEDRETAFRAAHTLKGLCLNLGFTKLGASAAALTDALRETLSPEAPVLLAALEADYVKTLAALEGLA